MLRESSPLNVQFVHTIAVNDPARQAELDNHGSPVYPTRRLIPIKLTSYYTDFYEKIV